MKKRFLIVALLALIMVFVPLSVYATDEGTSTGDLTVGDKTSTTQKNFQQVDDKKTGTYLYKSVEWVDKEKGTARITLKTNGNAKKTAVYALNDCTAHGFKKDIAKANIEFLLKNYDQVDIIVTDEQSSSTETKGIKIIKDVKDPSIMDSFTWANNRHWSFNLYEGLFDYLMGVEPGNESAAEGQKVFPSCIYTSVDSYYMGNINYENTVNNANASGVMPYSYDCWSILQEYQRDGRYFSMGHATNTKDLDTALYVVYPSGFKATSANFLGINTLVGLLNPAQFPGMTAAKQSLWNGSTDLVASLTYHPKYPGFLAYTNDVHADYAYVQTFEESKVPTVKNDITINDVVSDRFNIVSTSTSDESVQITNDGNAVTFHTATYAAEDPLILTIEVQLKDLTGAGNRGQWFDTNVGPATLTQVTEGSSVTLSVESPKLYFNNIQHQIITAATNGSIDEKCTVDDGESKTITYKANDGYVLKSVTVDGKAVDISKHPSRYTFSNVTADHKIKVVYAKKDQEKEDPINVDNDKDKDDNGKKDKDKDNVIVDTPIDDGNGGQDVIDDSSDRNGKQPRTGDSTDLGLWIVLLLSSMVMVAGLTVTNKKE